MFDPKQLVQRFDDLTASAYQHPQMESLVELCYEASSVPNEGRYPHIRVALATNSQVRILGQVCFGQPVDVTKAPALLSKLSFACHPVHRVLVVDPDQQAGKLLITGISPSPSSLLPLDGHVVIEAPAPGWVRILRNQHAVECFRGEEHDVSGVACVAAWVQRDWVQAMRRRFLMLARLAPAVSMGSKEVVLVDPAAWNASRGKIVRLTKSTAQRALADALADLLGAVRAAHHGGSILVLPSRPADDLPLAHEGIELAPEDPGVACYSYFAWSTMHQIAHAHPEVIADVDRTSPNWHERLKSNIGARAERAWLRIQVESESTAALTQVDGAVVLDHELAPRRAMAMIARSSTSPGSGLAPTGARHAAMESAVNAVGGAVGFTVSQDGKVTAMMKGRGRTAIVL